MAKKTALFEAHVAAGGKMVDFAGWEMPLHYGSQMEEHHTVRKTAGMFDVSHMTVVDLTGDDAFGLLDYLLANDIEKIHAGRAMYSCMLNESGGVIDDLIVYQIGHDFYRLVVNASTREKDIAWIEKQAQDFEVVVQERPDLAILAVQGPEALEKTRNALPTELVTLADKLQPFHFVYQDSWLIAYTGYTGEDGFELIVPNNEVVGLWDKLLAQGVKPCGLGARDTLRLEAGMNLYGQDMDEETTPLESGLAWTVAMKDEREFIGRTALEAQKEEGIDSKLVGLVLEGKGVLRAHQKVVVEGVGEGETTSGSFSPTLNHAVALARVPKATGEACQVEMRGKLHPCKVVRPPFVRKGERVY